MATGRISFTVVTIRKSASKLSTVILISGILIFSSAIPQPGFSQEEETIQPDVNSSDQVRSVSEESKIPPAVTEYMGRTIAETMSYKGAYWLDRDEREREERCSLLLNNLGLKPKMVVCDLGCGSGFHSLQIAELIPDGVVLAVDVQPEMLEIILERAEEKGLGNVTPVLGSYFTPRLPPESVDLVLLVDVYHEFSHPEHMLAGIRSALKPNGQIALVEFRMEDKSVPIKKLHKMSKKQIMKEFPANGFKLVREFDKLPWQHLMFFQKTELADDTVGGKTDEK